MKSRPNGCGPKGIVGKLIPDGLLGLSVMEDCDLHDIHYTNGGTQEDRKKADELFLANMLKKIKERSQSKLAKAIRKLQAYFYFWSVRLFGKTFFETKK